MNTLYIVFSDICINKFLCKNLRYTILSSVPIQKPYSILTSSGFNLSSSLDFFDGEDSVDSTSDVSHIQE